MNYVTLSGYTKKFEKGFYFSLYKSSTLLYPLLYEKNTIFHSRMVTAALYQPDIPQNVGAMMRLCTCLGVPLHIIEPCGFVWDERKIRQAGMDYVEAVDITRHSSWEKFIKAHKSRRIILMTTKSETPFTDFAFQDNDILLAGRESAGVPEEIHEAADARLAIPMKNGLRSLNIVTATAVILGEALRQTGNL